MNLSFTIPIKTPSVANIWEHWTNRAKRAATQKTAARYSCPPWSLGHLLTITLTRVSPRRLDSDNLASALKACRDGIASWLRIDDGSPLLEWRYAQEKGEPGVRVEVRRG